jgi:DNA modification methylase
MAAKFNKKDLIDTADAAGSPRLSAVPARATDASANGASANGNGHYAKPTDPSKSSDTSKPDLQTQTLFSETRIIKGDARHLDAIEDKSVDLVVTSSPYWRKRDYKVENQIGQEPTANEFVTAIIECLREWRRVLRPTGSVFLNIGDTYHNRSLAGIPGKIEAAAVDDRWLIRNKIIWAKKRGMPEPSKSRLANRYEYIFHFAVTTDYYYDLFAYAEKYGKNGANPGDIWYIDPGRHMGDHLAPFPAEIVERAITLACPERVCTNCGKPQTRIVRRTMELDPNRPQAKRAMEIAREAGLTPEHIAAVQATGVSDAGKALKVQNGTGRNSARVKELAAEAKKVLGGYFREFTFARRETVGWTKCDCDAGTIPGVLLDPFMGTGTALKIAEKMGRSAIGVDLNPVY